MRAIFTFFLVIIWITRYLAYHHHGSSDYSQTVDPNIVSEILPKLHRCSCCQETKVNNCIKDSLESIKDYLDKGVPQLNIPPFDPYQVMNIKFAIRRMFNSFVTIKQMRIYGLTNYKISNVNVSTDWCHLTFDAIFPFVELKSTSDMNATYFSTPTAKLGYIMNSIFTDVMTTITINGEFYDNHEHNEDRYFRVNNVTVEMKYVKSVVNIEHADFNINFKTYLNSMINTWPTFKDDIVPLLKVAASNIIYATANKIYAKFPMKMLLLP